MKRFSDISEIMEKVSMIVGGYAFSNMDDENIRILGLNYPNHAVVIRPNGEVLETNYLYFTSHCVVEAMHVHASDRRLTEIGSAKFFVKKNGDTVVKEQGVLKEKQMRIIRAFIKDNYKDMYLKWAEMSNQAFYEEDKP